MFARQYTEQLLEMIDEGILDAEHVVRCFTTYLSEDTVKNMMFAEELIPYDYDNEDEAIDDMYEIDDDNALEEEFI